MTKNSLNSEQRRTVEIIENLPFGRIERLSIRAGTPCYEQPPRIVQEIKLGSESDCCAGSIGADVTLKKEFDKLFTELTRLREGVVDIEVRHNVPFRLILDRCHQELAP